MVKRKRTSKEQLQSSNIFTQMNILHPMTDIHTRYTHIICKPTVHEAGKTNVSWSSWQVVINRTDFLKKKEKKGISHFRENALEQHTISSTISIHAAALHWEKKNQNCRNFKLQSLRFFRYFSLEQSIGQTKQHSHKPTFIVGGLEMQHPVSNSHILLIQPPTLAFCDNNNVKLLPCFLLLRAQ